MALWQITFAVATNEDWVDSIAVVENEGESDEAAYDLTGSDLVMQIRALPEKLKVILELSVDNGRIVINDPASDGKFTINVPKETVDNMKPGDYFYDIVWTQSDGRRVQFIEGTITVNLGITRDDP